MRSCQNKSWSYLSILHCLASFLLLSSNSWTFPSVILIQLLSPFKFLFNLSVVIFPLLFLFIIFPVVESFYLPTYFKRITLNFMKRTYNICFKFFNNSNTCINSGLVHIFVFSLEDSEFQILHMPSNLGLYPRYFDILMIKTKCCLNL